MKGFPPNGGASISARPLRTRRLAFRILCIAIAAGSIPLPAPTAAAFNTGQSITQFYECLDPNWQNCNQGGYLDSVNASRTGIGSNEESVRYGFRFPARGVAQSADFDLEAKHGYRWRENLQNSQGQWNQPGANFSNTTSLFGLRIDLDGSPPQGPNGASPFYTPTPTNTNVSFTTGLNNYDVAAGDFDSDGDDDLVVLAGATVQIRRFSGGNWANTTNYAVGTGTPAGVKAADLNKDGRMDAVIYTTSGVSSYIFALVQLPWGGARIEGPMTVIAGGSNNPFDFDVGDLTGDGFPDVAVIYGNRTVYWLNQGGGNNLDFWGTNTYSVKLQSLQYSNAPTSVVAAPSPCSAQVAQANLNNNVYIYWQTNFTTITTLTAHGNAVNGVAWSPDCQYLATASSDMTVLLWRTSNWSLAANLTGHTNAAHSVAFSSDSISLATGGADSNVLVWNLSALPPTLDYNVSQANNTIYTLAFSPNGSFLALGTGNNTVRILTTVDYSSAANLTGHSFAVRSVAYSPDGLTLLSGSADDKIFVWDAVNLTKTLELTSFTADVNRVAFNANGTRVIAAGSDGHVRVFLVSNWSVIDDVLEGGSFVNGADFDRTGEFLLTGGTQNYLRMWDRSVLTSLSRTYSGQEFSALSVAYSDDGRIAVGSEDGTVVVIALSNGTVMQRFRAHSGTVNRLAWAPGSAYLASAGSDGLVQVYDGVTWANASTLSVFGNVTGLDFAATGAILAAANASGSILAWNVPAFTSAGSMAATAGVNAIALDPTGTQLVSAQTDGSVRIWSLGSAWNFQNLTASGVLRAVDWSPDGTQIAAGGADRRTRTWWTSNWTLNSNVLQHSSDITSLSYSPDSTKIATGGLDARLYTYSRNGTMIQQYASAPTGATQVISVSWRPDSKGLAAGWHSVRFPGTRVQPCTICSTSITSYGISIGNADSTAGNDIVVAGAYVSTWQPDSAVWRLGFSGGSPVSYTQIVAQSNNYVPDAYRVDLGDLTGDGVNDLAVAADTSGSGSLYLISYNTTCNCYDTSSIVTVPIGGSVNEIVIADVTDDGHNDVVVAAGAATNQLQVAYWEATARSTGAFRITNISKFLMPLVGEAPTGIALGRFNNDSLLDVATSNGAAGTVWVFLQKDELHGSFTSAPISDLAFIGNPMVAAYLWWDDFNVLPNVTSYNASLTVDGGFSWYPVQENQTIDLNGTNSTTIQYRFEFWAARAAMTAWITSVWVEYLVETTPINISFDVARDFQPQNGDCYYPGLILGTFHCSFPADVINRYVLDNWGSQDANGTLYIPIRIKWERPATIVLTNLSIPYNKWPSPPDLVSPSPDSFADATPTFVVRAADTDSDNLRYHVQVSTDPLFSSGVLGYNQNESALGWGLPFYVAGASATVTTQDSDRLTNGVRYWWRAAAFDGLQWSDWSAAQNFTVDDLPPEGFANSPAYSTVETFSVSWASTDPPGGSGLAAAPYDVQFRDGIEGGWTDFQIATAAGSASFLGENGHTYCFRMRAVDAAGNQQLYITSDTGDTCTTIDTDRPTASIVNLSPYARSRNFEVSWSGDDGPSGSGIGGFDIQVMAEGGLWTTWLTGFSGSSAIYSAPDDRTYTFRVAARDRAGNIGDPSATSSTRVDTTPPTCQVYVPAATTTALGDLAVTFTCTDPQTGVAAYEYCVGTGPGLCDEMLPRQGAVPVALISGLTLDNGGTYHVSVHGLNAAGSWSNWVASSPVRVVIPGPSSHIEYLDGVWTSTNLTVTFGASDALGYPVVAGELQYRRAAFRYNALGEWQDWLTVTVDTDASGYTFEGDSIIRGYAYEFRFRARNVVGSWGEHATAGTLFVNQIPVAAGGADRIANISESLVLDGSSSLDYDGERDTLSYSWELDDGTRFDGATATVAFGSPGTHVATLTVSDGHEAATATVYILVLPEQPRQIAPGFDGVLLLAALIGAAAFLASRRAPSRDR